MGYRCQALAVPAQPPSLGLSIPVQDMANIKPTELFPAAFVVPEGLEEGGVDASQAAMSGISTTSATSAWRREQVHYMGGY